MNLVYKTSVVFFVFVLLAGFCLLEQAEAQGEEGLKAYYDLETEDPEDKSGNNLHGAPEGAPKLIDGAMGKAWEFNGTTRINIDYQDFKNATPELSVSCFILPEDDQGGHIIFEEGGAWTGFGLRILDGELQFGTICCGEVHPEPMVVSAELPDTEDWIDVAAVYDNGKMILYMNGKNVGEGAAEWQQLGGHGQPGSIGGIGNGNTAFAEGADVNDTPPGSFIGGIDEVRVYQRALQPDEIRSAAVSSRDKLASTWGSLKISY